MANARQQLRQAAREFIQETLRAQGTISLREMSATGLSKAALIDMMSDLQELGLANLTTQRGVYTAGPLIRYAPCTDTALQATLLQAIRNRPENEGYWSDLLLAEHVKQPRESVQRSLVTISRQQEIVTSFMGSLIIVRQAARA